jgi:hypothetical protein
MESQNQTPSRLSVFSRINWSSWLPSRGNAIFTLVVVFALFWAQSANALPWRAPASAATSTGTWPYQGRLADSAGVPITNTIPMIFRLYSAAGAGATPLWEEQWTGPNSVQVSDGLFNVMLGSLTPIPQNLVTGNSGLWLGITAGTDDEMTPRVQLGSVPFAVQALTVPDGSITAAKFAPGAIASVPVGTVISWYRPTADTPLPSGDWAIADGSTVTDVTSPFYNKALPNLTDRFVMGVAPSNVGTLGGSNMVDLSHTHTIPSHVHNQGSLYALVSVEDDRAYIKRTGAGFGATIANYTGVTHANNHWTDGGAAVSGNTGAWTGPTDGSLPAINAVDNRPQYVGLVYLIRIK